MTFRLLVFWILVFAVCDGVFCQGSQKKIPGTDSVITGHSLLFIDLPVFLNGIEIDEEDYEMLLDSKIHFKSDLSVDTLYENGYQSFRHKSVLLETKALLVIDGEPIDSKYILSRSQENHKLSIEKILDKKEGKIQFGNDGKNGVVCFIKPGN